MNSPVRLAHATFGVDERDGVRGALQEQTPLGFGASDRGRGFVLLGDVQREPDHRCGSPSSSRTRLALVTTWRTVPSRVTGRYSMALIDSPATSWSRAGEHLADLVRREERRPLADGFVGGPAEQLLGGAVPGQHDTVEVDGVDRDRRVADERVIRSTPGASGVGSASGSAFARRSSGETCGPRSGPNRAIPSVRPPPHPPTPE